MAYPTKVAEGQIGQKLWGNGSARLWIGGARKNLRRLNKKARKEGNRRLVFINSMSDTFEDYEPPVVGRKWNGKSFEAADVYVGPGGIGWSGERRAKLADLRSDMFAAADECDHLIFLLLTKRPENILPMWRHPKGGVKRDNVWLGATMENHVQFKTRLPLLLRARPYSPVLWSSSEPLLGDLSQCDVSALDWVVAGGETDQPPELARPTNVLWARRLRDMCQKAGVPFHWKQWGEWTHEMHPAVSFLDGVERFDGFVSESGEYHYKIGKGLTGRQLDGREWNQIPEVAEC